MIFTLLHIGDDRVNPSDFASHAFEQFAFGILRITPFSPMETSAQNFGMAPVSAEKLISQTSLLAAPRKVSEWIPGISPDC